MGSRLEKVQLNFEISPGEVIDRMTILGLKVKFCKDVHKKSQAAAERQQFKRLHASLLSLLDAEETDEKKKTLAELTFNLWDVNSTLWHAEDEIRKLDEAVFPVDPMDEMGEERCNYVCVARRIYHMNDKRSVLKGQINELFGHKPEVKEYNPKGSSR